MYPRVLVGCPTFQGKEYCLAEYVAAVKSLDYPNFDVLLIDNSETEEYANAIAQHGLKVLHVPRMDDPRDALIQCRNILREKAIAENYEYFLSLEQDVIPPPETLKTLLSYGKSYVTTVVFNHKVFSGKPTIFPMVSVRWEGHPGKLRYLKMEEVRSGKLLEVQQAHLACTLISVELLKSIEFRHEGKAFDDTCLSQDLLAQGHTLFCDTALKIKHMPNASFQRLGLRDLS